MANVGKIFGITALVGILAGCAYKGVSYVHKIKQASGNVNYNISFLRIHGLVGEGITKILSPTIRILFNLNIKNFTGFDIEVKNIYVKVQTQTTGSNEWKTIGTTNGYTNLSVIDGKEKNETLVFDFKGLTTINSLINKKNRHRIVMTYEFKGQSLDYTNDVNITGAINTYWQKAKNSINSLKGLSLGNLQTAL